MKSYECWNVILNDLENNRDKLWDFLYQQNKGDTTAEISHFKSVTDVKNDGKLVMVFQGQQPVYDESTRKARWTSMKKMKDKFIDDLKADRKPWNRYWRRKRNGTIARMFQIFGGISFPFMVVVYDQVGSQPVRIEYWHESQYRKKDMNGTNRAGEFFKGTWFPPGPAMFGGDV